MTAVEWLANELFKQLTGEPDKISLKEVLEQAKEMEKQQIIDARNNGFEASGQGQYYFGCDGKKRWYFLTEEIESEKYYNETFKKK